MLEGTLEDELNVPGAVATDTAEDMPEKALDGLSDADACEVDNDDANVFFSAAPPNNVGAESGARGSLSPESITPRPPTESKPVVTRTPTNRYNVLKSVPIFSSVNSHI